MHYEYSVALCLAYTDLELLTLKCSQQTMLKKCNELSDLFSAKKVKLQSKWTV